MRSIGESEYNEEILEWIKQQQGKESLVLIEEHRKKYKLIAENNMSFVISFYGKIDKESMAYYLSIIGIEDSSGKRIRYSITNLINNPQLEVAFVHESIAINNRSLIQLLLIQDSGLFKIKNVRGENSLHICVQKRNPGILEMILQKDSSFLNDCDNKGETPALYAVCHSNNEALTILGKYGGFQVCNTPR